MRIFTKNVFDDLDNPIRTIYINIRQYIEDSIINTLYDSRNDTCINNFITYLKEKLPISSIRLITERTKNDLINEEENVGRYIIYLRTEISDMEKYGYLGWDGRLNICFPSEDYIPADPVFDEEENWINQGETISMDSYDYPKEKNEKLDKAIEKFSKVKEREIFALEKKLEALKIARKALNIDIEEESETIVDKMQSLFELQFVF